MKSKIILGLIVSLAISSTCYAKDNYFVSTGLGVSHYGISNSTSAILSDNTTSSISKDLTLGLGYKINKDYVITLNVEKSKLSNIQFEYLYTTLNYNLEVLENGIQQYIGFIAGVGKSKWNTHPVSTTASYDNTAKNKIYGFQVGSTEKISQNISSYMEFKHIRGDFVTSINQKDLTHKYQNKIIGGLRYEF
jgi:hypothetical protein